MSTNATGYANVLGTATLGETLTLSLATLPPETLSLSDSAYIRYIYQELFPVFTGRAVSANPMYFETSNWWVRELTSNSKTKLQVLEILLSAPIDEPGEKNYTSGKLTTVTEPDGFGDVISYAWYSDGKLVSSNKSILITETLLGKPLLGAIAYTDRAGNLEIINSKQIDNLTIPRRDLNLTANNDILLGSEGLDYINVAGKRENFIVNKTDTEITLADRNGSGGTDTLIQIERLRFDDIVLAFDYDGATSAGGIYRLYKATFARTPDLGGLGFWINKADEGMSAIEMAERFVWTEEFMTLYGVNPRDNYLIDYDRKEIVTGFYQNVLGRAPDIGGLNFYVSAITLGQKTVGQVLAEISDSPENYASTIGQIAQGLEYIDWL